MDTVIALIKTAITILVAFLVYKFIYNAAIKTADILGRKMKMRNTLRTVLATLIGLVAILVIMDIWQVSLLPYLTALGIGGIAIGFAVQEPLSNFISGLLVILTGKLHDDDVVEIDGIVGTVEMINYNHTVLRTFDGRQVLIPNKQVWNQRLINLWPSDVRRFSMKVSVSYGSDLAKVLEVLKKCLEEEPLIEKSGVTNAILFSGFASSSVDFELLFWIKRKNYFDAINSLARRVREELEANGIVIPFPQLDVHIKERAV